MQALLVFPVSNKLVGRGADHGPKFRADGAGFFHQILIRRKIDVRIVRVLRRLHLVDAGEIKVIVHDLRYHAQRRLRRLLRQAAHHAKVYDQFRAKAVNQQFCGRRRRNFADAAVDHMQRICVVFKVIDVKPAGLFGVLRFAVAGKDAVHFHGDQHSDLFHDFCPFLSVS